MENETTTTIETKQIEKKETKIDKILLIGLSFSIPIITVCLTFLITFLLAIIPVIGIIVLIYMIFPKFRFRKKPNKKEIKEDFFETNLKKYRDEFSKKNI